MGQKASKLPNEETLKRADSPPTRQEPFITFQTSSGTPLGKTSDTDRTPPANAAPSLGLQQSPTTFREALGLYFQKVPQVRTFDDWIALNKGVFDEPFAGLDKFAAGAVFGVCSGYSARCALRFAAVLMGAGFVSLQVLQYYGYVRVNWARVQAEIDRRFDLDNNGKLDMRDLDVARRHLMRVLTWGFPCAGGFGAGFVIGFRGKFF